MQLKTCLVYKFVFLLFNIRYSSLEQTNKLDCGDENCTVPIGLGKAEVTISRNVEGFLTMKAGEEAQIFGVFGKDLFLIETDKDKRRGFVSQKLFREMRLKRKGLIKSNVTTNQRTKLSQMGPIVKGNEGGPLIQEEKPPAEQPASNESETPDVKPVLEGKTPSGQVIFAKEEPVAEKPVTENVTEEEEGDDTEEDEEENATGEEEEDDEESTETPEEESMLSKLANFITGADEEETTEEQNETSTETDQILVQNDTNQNLPEEKSQENEVKPQVIVETTTPLPDFNEIATPSSPVEMEATTPTPSTNVEQETPKPETLENAENVTEDLGKPDFQPIPDTKTEVTNESTEKASVPQEKKLLGNILTTPPPLLGLMKSQIKKEEKKPEVPVVEETKQEEPKPVVEEEKPVVEEPKPVKEEEKPEVFEEILLEKEINEEKIVPEDQNDPAPTEIPSLFEESQEKVTENPQEEVSELDKVKEKLGVAPEEPKKVEETPSEEVTTEKPVEEVTQTVTESPKIEEIVTEAPLSAASLGIDTYGNPPPPLKPLEEVKKSTSDEPTIQIDNKLDLETEEKVPEKVSNEVPNAFHHDHGHHHHGHGHEHHHHGHHHGHEHHHHEHEHDHKNDFQQKREAIRTLLEADVPKDGSEVESSEKKVEEPQKKVEGVPSVVEIRRNGKLVTPKDADAEQNKHESNPHSGEYCEAAGGACPVDSTANTISDLTKMFGLDFLLQDGIFEQFIEKTIEMFDLIIVLSITSAAVVFFLVLHSCVKRCMRESPLLERINHLERTLMTSLKENATLKNDLAESKGKLHQIEDTSFGSNEMVIALKKDLDDSEHIRQQLQQQCNILEAELQRSTEAGNELNKMLSDLLNSQTGSESILQSVEQLQKQVDEQQFTIESMTEALATKSRENSELQVQLSEISSTLGVEVKTLKARNDDVELEKICIENELKNLKKSVAEQIESLEKSKIEEIERIKQKLARKEKEALELHQKYRTSEAKIQALNEMINESKTNGGDVGDMLDSIDAKAELILVAKERDTLKEQLNAEVNSKKSMENYVKTVGDEIEKLKKEFSVAEKEKLEAQTKLDVLSSYFRQKESELQRELSTKEALWMQQQGETSTTVERVKSMQEEIQQLKSQNDSLKAEILAQDTANKAQIVALENKAHEAWLNARQSERKVEELRQESTILRRRLTSIAELQPSSANNSMNASNLVDGSSGGMPSLTSLPSLNSVPSPLRVESPNSPIMLPGMPPPPQFLPPGLMPPGPLPVNLPPGVVPPLPFMPPPPFDLAGAHRQPHGRIMSPQQRGYSPSIIDDDRYSPDSRYHDDYSVMSTRYDTETDFSPPPSPPKRNNSSNYNRQNGKVMSPQMNGRHSNNNNNSMRSKPNKGGFNSSGSQDSIMGSGSRKGNHGKI
ncbi:transport and Golgi organization protein 1-like isoform X2 [Culicoides brevitarsis]|uniref:transport and Golgi organization protein 1-like isoform X2 n=1 Tax=Culicoides brevitarsis TaxID=469753 RepID=UPI00307B2E75